MIYFAAALIAYLLGSIPFGFIAGRIAGIDVRQHGSGNIGATNTLRVLGKKYGYAVFIADVLKGFLAVRIALWLTQFDPSTSYLIGTCLGLLPVATFIAVIVWIAIFFLFRFVSLASIVAAVALPLSAWLLGNARDPIVLGFSLLIATLIIFRHRGNIVRLLQGREPRFDRK